uniref:Uncharacterized protein n=1 Tax=Glossina pallidipes TaxID=7398 RepID=A0A1B0GGM9_GLOPL
MIIVIIFLIPPCASIVSDSPPAPISGASPKTSSSASTRPSSSITTFLKCMNQNARKNKYKLIFGKDVEKTDRDMDNSPYDYLLKRFFYWFSPGGKNLQSRSSEHVLTCSATGKNVTKTDLETSAFRNTSQKGFSMKLFYQNNYGFSTSVLHYRKKKA